MSEERRKLDEEFNRIIRIVKSASSGDYPIIVVMAIVEPELEFVLGGSIHPDDRIPLLKEMIEAHEANGETKQIIPMTGPGPGAN